jgi:hypothetical protein
MESKRLKPVFNNHAHHDQGKKRRKTGLACHFPSAEKCMIRDHLVKVHQLALFC